MKSPPKRRTLTHVRELDGIRGIAAVVVVLHHLCSTSITPEGWGASIRGLRFALDYGRYGVDLFFVLSGFLITSLLIEDRASPNYYRNFYWKRALRILPLYVACLVGVYFLVANSHTYVILSALFAANFAMAFHVTTPGPFWTLAIEEQFYLLWPTVVRRRTIDAIRRWALVIGLSAILLRIVAAYLGHFNYQFTFFRCDGLALGAWMACRFEKNHRFEFKSRGEKLALAGTLLASIAMVVISGLLPDGSASAPFKAALLQTAVTGFAGCLIAVILAKHGDSSLAFFRSPVLTFFGLISYALYMFHLYVMYAYDHLRGPLQGGDLQGYWLRLGTIVGVSIALSLVSRYALELPANSLRKYVLRRP